MTLQQKLNIAGAFKVSDVTKVTVPSWSGATWVKDKDPRVYDGTRDIKELQAHAKIMQNAYAFIESAAIHIQKASQHEGLVEMLQSIDPVSVLSDWEISVKSKNRISIQFHGFYIHAEKK